MTLCDIRAAQLCSVTEIAPKTPFLFVNRNSIRYVFHAGPTAIHEYSKNMAYKVSVVLVLQVLYINSERDSIECASLM